MLQDVAVQLFGYVAKLMGAGVERNPWSYKVTRFH